VTADLFNLKGVAIYIRYLPMYAVYTAELFIQVALFLLGRY